MELPKRKPVRLPEYDYSSPGAYFVTVCTHDRRCILSNITVRNGCLPSLSDAPSFLTVGEGLSPLSLSAAPTSLPAGESLPLPLSS